MIDIEQLTKHTPGPWGTFLAEQNTSTLCVAPKDTPIGVVSTAICFVAKTDSLTDEEMGNALLIASAPDLLDEVKRFRAKPQARACCGETVAEQQTNPTREEAAVAARVLKQYCTNMETCRGCPVENGCEGIDWTIK